MRLLKTTVCSSPPVPPLPPLPAKEEDCPQDGSILGSWCCDEEEVDPGGFEMEVVTLGGQEEGEEGEEEEDGAVPTGSPVH